MIVMNAPALNPGTAEPAEHAASAGHLRGYADALGQNMPCSEESSHKSRVGGTQY